MGKAYFAACSNHPAIAGNSYPTVVQIAWDKGPSVGIIRPIVTARAAFNMGRPVSRNNSAGAWGPGNYATAGLECSSTL